jgi:UDP-N-acetylglucosamine 3-dehydrogenase
MMKKVGLGLIGLGYIGQIHLKNSQKIAGAYVAGVADLSKKQLNFARQCGAKKTYRNYVDLLRDPTVDSVVIGLPNHLHLQCAQMAAEFKKNILLEKPIARTPDEAKQIISAARKNSVKLMMGYPMRFDPIFRELKEQINGGLLGDVEVSHAVNIGCGPFFAREEKYAPVPVPDWWFNKELTGGGVLIDLGCHMINLFRWYFGEIIDIKSRLRRRLRMDFEDSATCLATFKSGTLGVINVGWFSQEHRISVELFGSVKHATTFTPPPRPLVSAVQTLLTGNPKNLQPFLLELQHFVNFTVKDISPVSSGEDGLKDLEAISMAYKNEI